jgi:hypothetical protein
LILCSDGDSALMLNRVWDFRSLLWYLCAAYGVVVVVSADSDQVLVQNKINIWPWTLIIFGALITTFRIIFAGRMRK